MTQKAHGIEIVNHKGQLVLDTINIEVFLEIISFLLVIFLTYKCNCILSKLM